MSEANLPGRLEVVSANPLVVLDGAHNEDAARALVSALPKIFPETRRIVVLGMLGPRDPEELIKEIVSLLPEVIICCTLASERAISSQELAQTVQTYGVESEIASDPTEAIERALVLSSEEDLILVTGSFYLLSATRASLSFD